jgi:uncharacterized protein (TIGR00255 family)
MPMVQSMTGFGAAEKDSFKVEIRSVNHRFLDISMKLPQNLSRHEMDLRNMVRERFSRGRFDILVTLLHEENVKVKINAALARKLYDALNAVREELSLSGSIGIETIAGFRELLFTEEMEYKAEALYSVFGEALDRLRSMRDREGEAIARDMSSRLEKVEEMNGRIALLCPDLVNECRKRFMERISVLFGDVKFDENRILQEAAIMAEKTDVSEEITRLSSHIVQMKKILSDGDTIGRKVEFLLQELNREVNTIASKADDYRISALSVEMKAEIEKMREQAQNIQ